MDVHDLPAVNASLNATSAVLLLTGHHLIKAGKRGQHRKVMLTAFGVSTLFLICYVIYHAQVGSVKFRGEGWLRPVYFTILISHVLLAATVPVLAILTLRRALRGEFAKHRKLARVTYPIWLYVSVTGVAVYLMLYHLV
ncbi:MAG TPA: DUF420 domain-containing protein [Bryobacteraceae bacterium]|jgi:uncharacterized membrane protein YozB (DUF420 family)